MSLKYNFGGIEGAASAVQGSVGDASAATSDRQLQSFVVEFDRPIDPVASGGDAFDFKAMEESEAAGSQVGTIKTFICPDDIVWLNGEGMDDLATYQPDTDGAWLLGDVDVGGIPVSMAEYGLMLA
jgi:hypothetical protein